MVVKNDFIFGKNPSPVISRHNLKTPSPKPMTSFGNDSYPPLICTHAHSTPDGAHPHDKRMYIFYTSPLITHVLVEQVKEMVDLYKERQTAIDRTSIRRTVQAKKDLYNSLGSSSGADGRPKLDHSILHRQSNTFLEPSHNLQILESAIFDAILLRRLF